LSFVTVSTITTHVSYRKDIISIEDILPTEIHLPCS